MWEVGGDMWGGRFVVLGGMWEVGGVMCDVGCGKCEV